MKIYTTAFGSLILRNSKTVLSSLDSVVNQKRQYPSIPNITSIIFTMECLYTEGRCDFWKHTNANVENKRKT